MISNNETLEKVYTAENHEELMDAYKDWAGDYERDTVQEYGYTAHIESANALNSALDSKESRILDAGCGTGLVGLELSRLGYRHMDALDYSTEMLAQAEKKAVYNELIQADLSKPLDLPDNKYDAVNCTGTFTYGHVGADAFEELIRVTRPGGIVCFTIREGAYEAFGYQDKMAELEKKNAWELLAIEDAQYFEQDNVKCKLCVYKVTH
jgi:predicted TPR repeat methyltransferase